ncbi:MAG: hypothetical protein Q7T71_07990 [Herbiconiux sp.]|nr:hypothetical protein [Herbiconiux sp.]
MSYPPPPVPPQPAYSPVPPNAAAPGPGARKRNPLGVAALVIGIVSFVAALIPIVNYLAVLLAFVGVVLGVIALVLAGRRKAAAVAGTIVSFVALAASVVLAIVYTFVFFGGLIGWVSEAGSSGPGGIDATSLPLIYQVDGTGSDVDVTYSTFVGDVQSTEQLLGQDLPFEESMTVAYGGADTYDSYTVTAVNGADGGDIECRILLDGQVLVEQSASGAYATATCTASGTDLIR